MSRRSLLSPEENLIRSQRRGVPNARTWSEAPFHTSAGWDGLEAEPEQQGPTDLSWLSPEITWTDSGWTWLA